MLNLTWILDGRSDRLCGLLLGCAIGAAAPACSTSSDDPEMASATSDVGDSPTPEMCMALEAEVDCGVFYLEEDCEEETEDGANTDTDGGSPGGNGPADTCDQTAAVRSCVLDAIANGTPFEFVADLTVSRDEAPPNGISGDARYVVTADGSGWEDTGHGDGICTWDVIRTRQPVDLSACEDLPCIVERLDAAADDLVCLEALQVCDE